MEAVLEVDKKNITKAHIKKIELEYGDMNYIIANLEEKVIDNNGEIYRYTISKEKDQELEKMIWEYENIDEYDYWPDKSKDHPPIRVLWRIGFYDEYGKYYHKNGALSYPPDFMKLIKLLEELDKDK